MTMATRVGLACGIALTMLTGCDTVKAPPAGLGDPLHAEAYPRITVEPGLTDFLYFGEVVETVGNSSRPLAITVPVRLAYDGGRTGIQYRFLFLDRAGRPVGTASTWRYRDLEPRVQTFLEGNALETTAADWRLEVRSAR